MHLTRRGEPLPVAEVAETGASRGQILILFAMFLVGMMGILGLATDLGMAFAQRRTMQNAADAGAMAGARAVLRWTVTSPTSAKPEVDAMVASNTMNTVPEVEECVYVDYANASQGGCEATVPASATGVRVRVAEEHATFFIRVVPGAPDTVDVVATATAQVETFGGFPSEAPFIVCGTHSWAVIDADGNPIPGKGEDIPILLPGSTTELNPAAFGVTFYIHKEKLSQANDVSKDAGCETDAARFNGVAEQDDNAGRTPGWFKYTEGTAAGPVRERVFGAEGCEVGEEHNCVMLLPIAVNDPNESEGPGEKHIFVVGYAAFYVTPDKDSGQVNGHYGKLLEDYLVSGPSDPNWCRDCTSGAAVIRLTI